MKKIAIIGAGISGLYLANLLEKESTFEYKIYERKKELNFEEGYGIQLSVNGVKLLNKIGFKNINGFELSFPKKVNFFEANNNNKICEIDIQKFNDEDNRYTTLKRSTLIKFLLNQIPSEKISYNIELKKIVNKKKIDVYFSNNLEESFDYVVVSDGIFSKTKSIICEKEIKPNFFNSIALRGKVKNYKNTDISIFMGPNFHFVIYPMNQNNEYNFILIIEKKLKRIQLDDKKLFESNDFLNFLINEINQKTFLNLADNIEYIKAFPIFVSEKLDLINRKNIFLSGDALFAFPPSFAQGASQSIESANSILEDIKNNDNKYYINSLKRLKIVNSRSKLNHFAFHLTNPMSIFVRNNILKYLCKNKSFLETYLGKIYRN